MNLNLFQIQSRARGFTLVEVVLSLALAAIFIGGLVQGYIISADTAEWSSYSLAAQSLAMQRLEQTRAAKWDPEGGVDDLITANFPSATEILDIPQSGAPVYANNYTTINVVSTAPLLKMIQIDCVWNYRGRGSFTNKIATYRGPDQAKSD